MSFKTDLITKRDMSKDFCWILQEPLVYENKTCEELIALLPEYVA